MPHYPENDIQFVGAAILAVIFLPMLGMLIFATFQIARHAYAERQAARKSRFRRHANRYMERRARYGLR